MIYVIDKASINELRSKKLNFTKK